MTERTFLDDLLIGGVKGKFYIDNETGLIYMPSRIEKHAWEDYQVYGRKFQSDGKARGIDVVNLGSITKFCGYSRAHEEIVDLILEKNPMKMRLPLRPSLLHSVMAYSASEPEHE